MSAVPADIVGVGATGQKLRARPGFDPMTAGIGPEEYFVFSRIDGTTVLRDVLLATGLPMERAVAIVQKLRAIGAILLPGEQVAPERSGAPPGPPAPSAAITPPTQPPLRPAVARTATPIRASGPQPAGASSGSAAGAPPQPLIDPHDLALPKPTAIELAALAEANDLSDRDRRQVLAMARVIGDPRKLLGVSTIADARTLKHAYFRLSKEVHPDRYYGKQLGSFKQRLSDVFEAITRAYANLSAGTDAPGKQRNQTKPQQPAQPPQTQAEYAAELYTRATDLEVGGQPLEAMKLFAAAVRMDPQVRYLRRAASCALAAEQPRTALEYAKKVHTLAPNDPSSARLLASAFRANGKLSDAEDVLLMAMAIKNENDSLGTELRNDLAEVRRLLAAQAAPLS